jgi:hypothetical protein
MGKKLNRLLNILVTALVAVVVSIPTAGIGGAVLGLYLLYKYVWKGRAPYLEMF